MLTRLFAIAASAIFLGLAMQVVPAAADDSSVTSTEDGWVHGRRTKSDSPKASGPTHKSAPHRSTPVSRDGTQRPSPVKKNSPTQEWGCDRLVASWLGSESCDEGTPSTPVTGEPGAVDHLNLVVTPPTQNEVRVALHLPDPTPHFGPDPDANEWKMLAVGYPIWLWTEGPRALTATATHQGLSMTLTAHQTATSFTLGDGHRLSCATTTPYPEHPTSYGRQSPSCGYRYATRSRPGHDYTVTATTHWRVTWSAGGRTGTLTTTHTGSRTLAVGELQALIKG